MAAPKTAGKRVPHFDENAPVSSVLGRSNEPGSPKKVLAEP